MPCRKLGRPRSRVRQVGAPPLASVLVRIATISAIHSWRRSRWWSGGGGRGGGGTWSRPWQSLRKLPSVPLSQRTRGGPSFFAAARTSAFFRRIGRSSSRSHRPHRGPPPSTCARGCRERRHRPGAWSDAGSGWSVVSFVVAGAGVVLTDRGARLHRVRHRAVLFTSSSVVTCSAISFACRRPPRGCPRSSPQSKHRLSGISSCTRLSALATAAAMSTMAGSSRSRCPQRAPRADVLGLGVGFGD